MTTLDFAALFREIDGHLNVSPADFRALKAEEQDSHPLTKLKNHATGLYVQELARNAVESALVEKVPFVLSTEADILNRPSPKWLVQDLIQESTICLLASPGGLGKTFLALAIARAMASGGHFFQKETQKGRTLYVVAEGAAAFGDRVKAWNHAHPGWVVPDDGITYIEAGVNLKDPESVATLAHLVREGDYSLVILDTLNQLAYFENENNNAEIGTTFRAIKTIRDAREGTSVLVLDHTPVGGGKARGGTAKRDNSDTVIMAIPHGEGEDRSFTLSTRNEDGGKQKDGNEIAWHGFHLQSVLNSAIISNNGGKRAPSPLWAASLAALQTGPQTTTQLREACDIEGDMNSPKGKQLKRELTSWERDGLVSKSGSSTRPVYTLTPQAEGLLT